MPTDVDLGFRGIEDRQNSKVIRRTKALNQTKTKVTRVSHNDSISCHDPDLALIKEARSSPGRFTITQGRFPLRADVVTSQPAGPDYNTSRTYYSPTTQPEHRQGSTYSRPYQAYPCQQPPRFYSSRRVGLNLKTQASSTSFLRVLIFSGFLRQRVCLRICFERSALLCLLIFSQGYR